MPIFTKSIKWPSILVAGFLTLVCLWCCSPFQIRTFGCLLAGLFHLLLGSVCYFTTLHFSTASSHERRRFRTTFEVACSARYPYLYTARVPQETYPRYGSVCGSFPLFLLSSLGCRLPQSTLLLYTASNFWFLAFLFLCLSAGCRLEVSKLCENHARKMRTFFTRRLEPKTRSSYHIKWSNAKWNTSSLLKTKLS